MESQAKVDDLQEYELKLEKEGDVPPHHNVIPNSTQHISPAETDADEDIHTDDGNFDSSNEPNHSKYPDSWYVEDAQLKYIADCNRLKLVPSGYFLRNMNCDKLTMRRCVLGNLRTKPICNSIGTNQTITCLNLTDACLSDKFIVNLASMFKTNSTITTLNLSKNQLTSHCAENLCDILASSAILERIDLSQNCFDDKSSTFFAELMATSLRMSYLNLSFNGFADGATLQFGRALPQATSLEELNLSWNRLGTGGMRYLAKGLADNKNIKILDFSFNGLGPKTGLPQLAVALKKNRCLDVLNLTGNRLSPEGSVLLSKGLLRNTTLRVLNLSRNPFQTAGCFALLTGILRNSNCGIRELNFEGIFVNEDFRDLQDEARKKLPNLVVRTGKFTTEKTRVISPKFLHPDGATPKEVIQRMGRITGVTLGELLKPLDPTGDKLVTRQMFVRNLYIYMSRIGIDLTEEQIQHLIQEVDPGDGEINFKDFEL